MDCCEFVLFINNRLDLEIQLIILYKVMLTMLLWLNVIKTVMVIKTDNVIKTVMVCKVFKKIAYLKYFSWSIYYSALNVNTVVACKMIFYRGTLFHLDYQFK